MKQGSDDLLEPMLVFATGLWVCVALLGDMGPSSKPTSSQRPASMAKAAVNQLAQEQRAQVGTQNSDHGA